MAIDPITQDITSFPPPPSPATDPDNFDAVSEPFFNQFSTFTTEANTAIDEINTAITGMNSQYDDIYNNLPDAGGYSQAYIDSLDAENIKKNATSQTKKGSLTIGEELSITNASYSGTTITLTVDNTFTDDNLGDNIYISGVTDSGGEIVNGAFTIDSYTSTTVNYIVPTAPTGTLSVSAATLYHGGLTAEGTSSLNGNVKIVDFGTVTTNNRYVIDNPFTEIYGEDAWKGCIAIAEIYANGVWAETAWRYHYANGGYGTRGHSLKEGIVVQTGDYKVLSGSASHSGGGHDATTQLESASCRVKVLYIGEAKNA